MIRNWIRSLLLGLAALTGPSNAAGIWTDGHGDIGLAFEGGEFDLHYHLDNSTVDGVTIEDDEFQPEEIIAFVPDGPGPRPDGATWDFAGVGAAEPIWYLDQTQLVDRPWPGIGTEELSAGDFVGNLTFELTGFSGPGQLAVFDYTPFGLPRNIYIQTSNGISGDDAFNVPTGTHAHFNWWFTAPGVYTLDIMATGELSAAAGGGTVSDAGTFTFHVAVPEPTSGVLLVVAVSFTSLGLRRAGRRR